MKFTVKNRKVLRRGVIYTYNRFRSCFDSLRNFAPTLIPLPGRYHSKRGQFTCTENGKVFVTYRVRPIRAQIVDTLQVFDDSSDTAIVIQGPLVKKHDFTFETVKLYRQIFPGSIIIFSTWRSEPKEELSKIEKLGAHISTKEAPPKGGLGTHNLQMTSSHAGALFANFLGAEFVMKTRSDQRIYNPFAIRLMKGLLQSFPLSEEASKSQDARLAVISFSSFAYRIYGLSDMLHFGKSTDILKYWNGSQDNRLRIDESMALFPTILDVARQRIAETYYMTNFLQATDWDLKWTLEDYWAACMERFVIVDAASLDLYWPKYSLQEDRWKNYRYPITHQELDFAFWIGLGQKANYEKSIVGTPEKALGFPLLRETDLFNYR